MKGPCLLCEHMRVDVSVAEGCPTCGFGVEEGGLSCAKGLWETVTSDSPADIRRAMRHGWTCEEFSLAPDCGPVDVAYLFPKKAGSDARRP